jgi:LmbE family N-acetylglucosaminyl deacetylase
MPQSSHDQAAELHNLASHAHATAADAHGKADHRTAHELSKQAYELSRNALKHSEQLNTAAAESTQAETGKGEKVEAARIIRSGLPL